MLELKFIEETFCRRPQLPRKTQLQTNTVIKMICVMTFLPLKHFRDKCEVLLYTVL